MVSGCNFKREIAGRSEDVLYKWAQEVENMTERDFAPIAVAQEQNGIKTAQYCRKDV